MKALVSLKVSDIESILDQMPAKFSRLPANRRRELVDAINMKLSDYRLENWYSSREKPSIISKKLNKIKKYSHELTGLLRDDLTKYLSYDRDTLEATRWLDPQTESYEEFYERSKKKYWLTDTQLSKSSYLDQLYLVKSGYLNTILIQALMLLENATCKKIAVNVISNRYMFVYDLAVIFYETFRVTPVGTLEGPWEFFLSEILSRCEKKKISPRGAHELWPKVVDFVRYTLPDNFHEYWIVSKKRMSRN